MKKLILTIFVTLVAGCSVLNDIGRYAQENPIVVDAATRQAVFRYIDAGDTEVAKDKRARQVVTVIKNVDDFLQGNPTASTTTLLVVVESQIKWDKLALADRVLVQDVMSLVRLNLENKQREGLLDENAVIGIRAVLKTAQAAALLL